MNLPPLTEDTLLLTPNRRLQEYWTKKVQLDAQRAQCKVWLAPEIYAWSHWLLHLHEVLLAENNFNPLPSLLTDVQVQLLMEQIIGAEEHSDQLLNIPATAKTVLQAWRLVQEWQLDLHDAAFAANEDTHWFQKIAKKLTDYFQKHQSCDVASLIPQLLARLSQSGFSPPRVILHSGFNEWTPLQRALLQAFLQKGTRIQALNLPVVSCQSQTFAARDTQHEIITMARWAKACWQKGDTHIACVVPDLAQRRASVETLFQEQFSDNAIFPVNISGGTPLAEFPVVHSALLFLSLCLGHGTLAEMSAFLRSPYLLGGMTEYSARANLDRRLREYGENPCDIATLQKLDLSDTPSLAQVLPKLLEMTDDFALPRVWAKRFSTLLADIHWPGERELDSIEYQCIQRWLKLLDDFSTLGAITAAIDFKTALFHCQHLAMSTMFQGETPTHPIQVLGLLEAIGHPFEKMWIMGLSLDAWPAPAQPNPFIPAVLQQKNQLPHSTADRELEYSLRVTQAFQNGAREVTFSYAQMDGEIESQCSRLLEAYPLITETDLNLAEKIDSLQIAPGSLSLDTFIDTLAPPLEPKMPLRGGSFILKSMAACPFQAFARYRLGAKSLAKVGLGLSGLERGLILHRALEIFWRQTKNQSQLLAYSEAELEKNCLAAILHATQPLRLQKSRRLSPLFFELEHARTLAILLRFLNCEKNRPSFRVNQLEDVLETEIEGLKLRLRVDRIDMTANGETLVIDYKTALTSMNSWFGDRLDEPQLPLYAISLPEVQGLLLASLKSDAIGFSGISDTDIAIPGVIPIEKSKHECAAKDWPSQIWEWENTLKTLAKRFQQGIAEVDPKQGVQTCRYCDLKSFCRIAL